MSDAFVGLLIAWIPSFLGATFFMWQHGVLQRQCDETRTELEQARERLSRLTAFSAWQSDNQEHTIAALRAELAAQVRLTGEARQEANHWRAVCRGQVGVSGVLQNQHRMES